jgi:hypothetical protein
MKPDYGYVNIHDHIERHNIPAPPVDPDALKEALAKVEWCNSVEEAVKLIIDSDKARDVITKHRKGLA